MGLIPKDQIYCSPEALTEFKELISETVTQDKIYVAIMEEKEEIWFDIYRSITS